MASEMRRAAKALVATQVETFEARPPVEASKRRLERARPNDPGIGVVRHADAGYPDAIATARREALRLPMLEAGD